MHPPHDEPRAASLDPTELSTVTAGVSVATGERIGHRSEEHTSELQSR